MYRFLFIVLLSSVTIACVTQFEDEAFWGSSDPTPSTLAVYKQKTLAELGQFDIDRNVDIHETLDDLARQLWGSRNRAVLKSSRTTTFKEYPILELIDIDGDGSPEQFSYSPETGGDTMDFGFLFDLNKDGKADYLVYYQGNMIAKPLKIIYNFHHLVDSDYDGKVDIWVYPGIDLDGDKFQDEGINAWLYDTNRDGKIDKGEHQGNNIRKTIKDDETTLSSSNGKSLQITDEQLADLLGFSYDKRGESKPEHQGTNIRKTIKDEDGFFNIKCEILDKVKVGDAVLLEFSNKMLNDINAMMD